jgi:hypothetical protein
MEPPWSDKAKAEAWIEGYDDATTAFLLGNYSADGCPKTRVYNSSVNGGCFGNWDQQKMWHMSDEHMVLLLPQIYNEDMAIEWMRIDEYGYHAQGSGVYFTGAMGGQNTDNNTAHLAHLSLGRAEQPVGSLAQPRIPGHYQLRNSYLRFGPWTSWPLKAHSAEQ